MATSRDIGDQLRRADKSHQLIEKVEKGQNTTIDTLNEVVVALGAQLIVRIEVAPPHVLRRLAPVDRLAVAARLLAVLPRLPDVVVDGLLQDIAVWETEYPPQLS